MDRDESTSNDSCLKLLASDEIDDLMKLDRYHPSRCNEHSVNHHHPFHNHMVDSNLRTGKGLYSGNGDGDGGVDGEEVLPYLEWIRRYKQMGATNVFVDAFECWPVLSKLQSQELSGNVNERLMGGQRAEQLVFVLTHFHWDSYRGLVALHSVMFNERSNNVLYCSKSTAKLIRCRVPGLSAKYIKTLSLDQSTPIPEGLPRSASLSMMAVDSLHCSGSILCILSISASDCMFDDAATHHLHSGDCNLSESDWADHPVLRRFGGKIDSLWMDTKSLSFWLSPLSRCEALTVITRHILDAVIPNALWAQSPVLIEIGKYSVGLEPVLVDIARHVLAAYSMKLCVQQSDVEMLKVLGLWTEQKLHRFFQTLSDWKQCKEALRREHEERLHRFTERRRSTRRRKVAAVEFGPFFFFRRGMASFCGLESVHSLSDKGGGQITPSSRRRPTAEVAVERRGSGFRSVRIAAVSTTNTVWKWRAKGIGPRTSGTSSTSTPSMAMMMRQCTVNTVTVEMQSEGDSKGMSKRKRPNIIMTLRGFNAST